MMNRIALALSLVVLGIFAASCEQHSSADLPRHYKKKDGGHDHGHASDAGHSAKPPADHGGEKKVAH